MSLHTKHVYSPWWGKNIDRHCFYCFIIFLRKDVFTLKMGKKTKKKVFFYRKMPYVCSSWFNQCWQISPSLSYSGNRNWIKSSLHSKHAKCMDYVPLTMNFITDFFYKCAFMKFENYPCLTKVMASIYKVTGDK